MEIKKTNKRPAGDVARVPKRWIRMVNSKACLVIIHKAWAGSGYGAKTTKVIHRWPPKSVLERAGVL